MSVTLKVTNLLTKLLDKHNLTYRELRKGDVDKRHKSLVDELSSYTLTNDSMLDHLNIVNVRRLQYIRRSDGLSRRRTSIPVDQYDLDMNLISSFDSITDASKATKVNAGDISSVCNNKKRTAGGYIWKRKN